MLINNKVKIKRCNMKKIVILGCENSHATKFLNYIRDDKKFNNVKVLGIYSHEREASEKLGVEFGVHVMDSYDEMVGKVDGVIITARHGDNHLKYAKPYISSGVPMFIDKPITVKEEEAIELMKLCRDNGVKISGGSCLKYAKEIQDIKEEVNNNVGGKTLGGFLRGPLNIENQHGGFFFLCQHLSEMITEAFGRHPKSVMAFVNKEKINFTVRYEQYDINALYLDRYFNYYVSRQSEQGASGGIFALDEKLFYYDFESFYNVLMGGEQEMSYEDFIAPVFLQNAVYRSMASGKEEVITKCKI